MAENEKYQTTLEGPQIDDALEQMNLRIPEGWAVGTRDGEDVPSTSQFYHNNAKYYASRAQAYSPIYMNVTSSTNARTIYDSAMMAYSNNGNMMIRVLVTDEGQSNYVWLRLLRRTNASNGNYRFDFAGVISPGVAPSPESGERKIAAFSVQRGGNDYIKYGPVIYTVPTKDYVDTVFQNMSAAIDLKAPLASPHLTGTPTTPTATAGDNSTQIANTAFVQGELNEVATELSIAINGKANKSDLARTEEEALSAFVTEEATPADIVTFTDGASNIPVKSFVGSIVPQQSGSGDPSPSNIRPISGWTGANIYRTGANVWDEQWEVGSLNWSTGAPAASNDFIRSKNFIPVTPGATYYLIAPTTGMVLYGYDSNQANGQRLGSYSVANLPTSITIPDWVYYFKWRSSTNATTYPNDVAINYPSSVTNYHAYNGQTILLDFGQTVYAGTLTALGGGLWQVQPTHKIDALDSHTWNYGGNNRFNATGFSDMKQDGLRSEYIYCSCYAPNVGGGAYDPFTIYNGTGGYLYVVDDRTTDGATLKTLLAGQKMVYSLATLPDPITITGEDLQTLLGANTVWLDCGSVTGMTYRADTKLYIQKLLNGGTRTLAAAPIARVNVNAPTDEVDISTEEVEEPTVEE